MRELPTGTVTFLFTDIAGSTSRWERETAAMGRAVARHDQLMRAAVEQHHGAVFKTVGDAFYAAFRSAPEALAAAVAAQRALTRDDATRELRVRMALHTGAADARDGDYFGPPLNRVARLLSLAHGGQVLLSQTAADLVRDALPDTISLHDLGEHRLKDLVRPERIYQLVAPDLRADFPALRSLDALPHNLPVQPTSFVGREREIEQVVGLLRVTRLLTLTGAGGVGKTRLALQVAADMLDPERFPDGVFVAELAPLADPALVPRTVASVLGLREESGRSSVETVALYLKAKRLLLVLDNAEHLVDAAASLADRLLRGCPDVRLLVTSREALGIGGETAFRLPSMTLPAVGEISTLPVDALTQYEAVRLFIDRARTANPRFLVAEQNAPAVAAICHRLDGIPLALELAAARVRLLSPEQIHARLDDRFRLLTGGSRTALPRQQTLRAAIDWSYALLSDAERVLLRRVSVFVGGFTLEAVEAVCPDDSLDALLVLDLLAALVDKSLVLADEEPDGETRYRLLESVRQYAQERLFEGGDGAAVRDRHLAYWTLVAERLEPKLLEPNRATWLRYLAREHDNLRAAFEWSLTAVDREEPGEVHEAAMRLAAALWWFWFQQSYLHEGRERVERALSANPRAAARLRAMALQGAGWLSQNLSDYSSAEGYFGESLWDPLESTCRHASLSIL